MNKTIELLKHEFESSASKTPEFKQFCRTFKSEFKKVLNNLGCFDFESSNGHFEIQGYFNSADGQLWYFSMGDVRGIGPHQLLVRTAKHRKDFKGGSNNHVYLEGLSMSLETIINKHKSEQNDGINK